jgi:alkyl sulfatase BDS1-like metallo-beta-lactamase superfamily hydrolase
MLLFYSLMLVVPLASQAEKKVKAIESKSASKYTKAANAQVLKTLPFSDKKDFENAQRGFIAKPVWDLEEYKKYITLDKIATDTVNPSLWRNAQLNMIHGLFKVTDDIFQVRGYDLSNIIFVKGKTEWIVLSKVKVSCSIRPK